MSTHHLTIPLIDQDIEILEAGDIVYLSGLIYTSRDMGHRRISDLLEEEKPLPVDFQGSVIFHAGPVVIKNNERWKLSVIGPTTSIRMEPYAEMVAKLGVKAIIGKGGMNSGSLDCFKKYKQVYLQAPPGCAVKLGMAISEIKSVYWLDFGMPEALWVLEVNNFGPLIVTMDCKDMSLHQLIKNDALVIMEQLFKCHF